MKKISFIIAAIVIFSLVLFADTEYDVNKSKSIESTSIRDFFKVNNYYRSCSDYRRSYASFGLDHIYSLHVNNECMLDVYGYKQEDYKQNRKLGCDHFSKIFEKYVISDLNRSEEKDFLAARDIFREHCGGHYVKLKNKINDTIMRYSSGLDAEEKKFLSSINVGEIAEKSELEYFRNFSKHGFYDKALSIMKARFNRLGSNDIETLAEFQVGLPSSSESFRALSLDNTMKSIALYKVKYPYGDAKIQYVDDVKLNVAVCKAADGLLSDGNFTKQYNINSTEKRKYYSCDQIWKNKLNIDFLFNVKNPQIKINMSNTDMGIVCLWNTKYMFDTVAVSNEHSISPVGTIGKMFSSSSGSQKQNQFYTKRSKLQYDLNASMLTPGMNYLTIVVYEKELRLPKDMNAFRNDIDFEYAYDVLLDNSLVYKKMSDKNSTSRTGPGIKHYYVLPISVEIGIFGSKNIKILESVPIKDRKKLDEAIIKLEKRLKSTAGSVVVTP